MNFVVGGLSMNEFFFGGHNPGLPGSTPQSMTNKTLAHDSITGKNHPLRRLEPPI